MTVSRLLKSSIAAAATLFWAGCAQAATFDLTLTGVAAAGHYSSQDIGATHYDQWVLSLSGLDAMSAITVHQGDMINATITLDMPFTIPASQQLTSFALVLGGSAFPGLSTASSGSTAFFNAGSPVIDGAESVLTSSQLDNAVDFFPPNNGPITFDSVISTFTITDLSLPATLDYSLLTYTLFSPSTAGVPEPAAWTMMLIGFGGLGAMVRSRRRATIA
ncbi:PEPxxWA-CTERM sorting domain-containing protein [Phenylobacterium sp.]|uniref:PEPxxWA-CTERM sorting domain-containing protein n=1 Tax=Phenylobacterium sp. TaxID=1871053 RepID=UPI0025F9E140|nr:PEPxxWA-CTERM sorting domain-containing protein [Phenylobacterium sp.]